MPHIVITGAGRGIGLELARQYLAAGWRVTALQRAPSEALSALPGRERLRVVIATLTDDHALQEALAPLRGETVDVLINNAGMMGSQGFGHFDRDEWREVFDINVYTPLAISELLADAVARSERGRLLTVSSELGSIALNESGGMYAYRASKAAVNAIVRSMAIDLLARGILVAGLHPGWVRTDMGGEEATLSVEQSVNGLREVIDGLDESRAGRLLAWNGETLPW